MTSAIMLIATACSSGGSKTYSDGTYTGQSEVYTSEDSDEEEAAGDGYGVVNLTIENNKITACEFQTYMTDGTLKDSEYGKKDGEVKNSDYYNKAQKAVAACDEYASQLVQNGSLDGIDAISGATINFNEFKEAVNAALKQAEE